MDHLRTRSRTFSVVILAAAMGLVAPTSPGSADAAQPDPGVHIHCDLNVTLDFSPAIGPTLQTVDAAGKGWLGDKAVTAADTPGTCVSPDGTAGGISGSTGAIFPSSPSGGSGEASGPQNCTSSNLPNGTGQITWDDGTQIQFDWQFGFTAGGFAFSGQVTASTAAWSAPGDQFLVSFTKFTQNGGEGAGVVPIVSCFLPGGVESDEFTGVFQLFTPAPGVTPSITVQPGACQVFGGANPRIEWTNTVTGLGFPASSTVRLDDTSFVFGTNPTTSVVRSAGLRFQQANATTNAAGEFSVGVAVSIPYEQPEPAGTIEQNSDSVVATSGAAVAANRGGPNFCEA